MARYDVFRSAERAALLLDCQSDLLYGLSHRLTVPLVPIEIAPKAMRRLNPEFRIGQTNLRMMTQFAAAVPIMELRNPVASLGKYEDDILAALDMLIFGF